jgi:hypothetical protein
MAGKYVEVLLGVFDWIEGYAGEGKRNPGDKDKLDEAEVECLVLRRRYRADRRMKQVFYYSQLTFPAFYSRGRSAPPPQV